MEEEYHHPGFEIPRRYQILEALRDSSSKWWCSDEAASQELVVSSSLLLAPLTPGFVLADDTQTTEVVRRVVEAQKHPWFWSPRQTGSRILLSPTKQSNRDVSGITEAKRYYLEELRAAFVWGFLPTRILRDSTVRTLKSIRRGLGKWNAGNSWLCLHS